MNYVSLDVLKYAAMLLEAAENHSDGHLTCGWLPDPGQQPPCGAPAEYLVPAWTRATAGGDIERAPGWFCREHLELELGERLEEQPVFRRIENPDEPG